MSTEEDTVIPRIHGKKDWNDTFSCDTFHVQILGIQRIHKFSILVHDNTTMESLKEQFFNLCEQPLYRVLNGQKEEHPIKVKQVLEKPTIVLVIRRPGCPLCREQAQALAMRYSRGEWNKFATNVNIIAVIREVSDDSDDKLGAREFQNYFLDHPVYYDPTRAFYKFLGLRKTILQKLPTWNPIKLYSSFKEVSSRLTKNHIEGNSIGSWSLLGGLLLLHPTTGVLYYYLEKTGFELPFDEIASALAKLFGN